VALRPRPTARVLLITPDDRILLFRGTNPETGRVVWFTPGGGLRPGESYTDAARREVREEVGVDLSEIGPCVWTRRHVLPRTTSPSLDLRERFFVARVPDTSVDTTGFTRAEADSISESRWMTPEEIAELRDIVAPRRLAELLLPIFAGDYPSPPIDVGI
jgi:ADP-ribose pyrophosphatase YjhB (NUDIX family)